jgi:hypothetical protein
MFHMLRTSRWPIPIVLLAICFAEDRELGRGESVARQGVGGRDLQTRTTEVPLDSQGLVPTSNQGETDWHIRPGLYGAITVGGPIPWRAN